MWTVVAPSFYSLCILKAPLVVKEEQDYGVLFIFPDVNGQNGKIKDEAH